MNSTIIIGLLIPFLGTMLGSGFVFLMQKDMPVRLQKALLEIVNLKGYKEYKQQVRYKVIPYIW